MFVGPAMAAPANSSDEPVAESGECRAFFSPDSQALFNFVDSRNQVDYRDYEGLKIANIKPVVLPIFNEQNPEEDNWLFRTANALHIETRPSTVERQMIIEPGQPLNRKLLRENERLLRDNDYLVDAMIVPEKICGDSIYLLAVVRDIWTLTPTASASRAGGENSTSAGVTEDNLLGTGQSISVGYFRDADRSGKTFSYEHPDVLGEHATLSMTLQDNSDGEVRAAGLVRPFYQLDSRWSAGVIVDERSRIETIEDNDVIENEYREFENFYEGWYGWSPGRLGNFVHRVELGATDNETRFEKLDSPISAPPPDKRFRYPWLAWESIEDRYWTTSNISHSHRHEDILLGFYTRLRAGYARKAWNSTVNAIMFRGEQRYTASFGEHHLMQLSLSADGRHNVDTDLPEETYYRTLMQYYHFPDRKNRWYARARYVVGRNLGEDTELTAGGADSLRGYPDDVQRGNRQWLFTVERRHFTDIHLFNLAYIGGAAYVDAGRTWDVYELESRDNPTLANIGLGLRATPSKFNVDSVLHLDVAVPLVDRDQVKGYQIIVTAQADF